LWFGLGQEGVALVQAWEDCDGSAVMLLGCVEGWDLESRLFMHGTRELVVSKRKVERCEGLGEKMLLTRCLAGLDDGVAGLNTLVVLFQEQQPSDLEEFLRILLVECHIDRLVARPGGDGD